MRFVGPYTCLECAAQSDVQVSCPRCGGAMCDVDGRRPARPRRFDARVLGGAVSRGAATLGASVWLIAATVTFGLLINRGHRAVGQPVSDAATLSLVLLALVVAAAVAVGALVGSRGRRWRAWCRAEGERLAARRRGGRRVARIADLRDSEPVRFVGTVRVLEPARGVPGLAALHDLDDDRAGGVYLVEGGSGAALVDLDCFELWSPAEEPAALALREGAQVEVIGSGRWAPARGRVEGGYRDARVFLLAGAPDEPLHLKLLQD
ncbi:MAG: hypothetical protein EVA89_38835 [Sandaracinaceae bacterium]|nr:MAG: hypothetical protein EVA89_38835 [Sandaracinaceae bacterium]